MDGVDPALVREHLDRLESRYEAPDPVGWTIYRGRRVEWLGRPGFMVRVTPDIVHATAGNLFDWDQVAATALYMQNGGAMFRAPPAHVEYPVDARRVADTQRADARGELFQTDGMTRPFTTGDDDLDEALCENLLPLDAELEDQLAKGGGDLAVLTFGLRNGNHRTYAAFIAGEPFVWVELTNPIDIQQYRTEFGLELE